MDNLNLIEKYLNEELNTAELAAFDRLVKEDPEFAEEVRVAVTLNANFKVQQKLRFQGLLKKQEIQKTPIRRLPLRRLRSIAAVLVFLLAVAMGWMIFGPVDTSALADEYLVIKYTSPMVTLDPAVDLDSNWKNAITAYQDKQFPTAIAAIERSLQDSSDSGNVEMKHFYLGLSYLYQKVPNAEKALIHLEKSKKSSLYKQQANWFMSLAFLKQGEGSRSRKPAPKISNG